MIEDIEPMVSRAVSAVFGTMLNLPVEQEPPGSPIVNGEPQIAGSVGFIGTISGVIYVYSSARFARVMTSGMLGLDEPGSLEDEIVNDTVGEITNMVVGQVKSRLADRGLKCVLTIPSIVRGSHIRIEPTADAEIRLCLFRCRGDQVVVEIMLKPTGPEIVSFDA